MLQGTVKRLLLQTRAATQGDVYVAIFDVFEGSNASGLLIGHGAVDCTKPKDWSLPGLPAGAPKGIATI